MFQACAVVNKKTGGMFLGGEMCLFSVPRLAPVERTSSLLWWAVLRAVARLCA